MKKSLSLVLVAMLILSTSTIHGITNQQYVQYTKNNSALVADKVVGIEADTLGGVWVATSGSGAIYIDSAGKWHTYMEMSSGLKNNFLNDVTLDSLGNTHFATNIGVSSRMKDNTWNNYFMNENKIFGETVTSLAADGKGGLWHGVTGYGAYYKDADGVMTHYSSANSSIPSSNVSSFAFDQKGGVWIGTELTYNEMGGVAYLSADGKWTLYNANNSKLPSNRVREVYVAKNGAVWIGTINGLAKFYNNEWVIYSNNSVWEYDVRSVTEDSVGNIYAATWGDGLLKIDTAGKLTNYKSSDSPIPNNYIYEIEFDTKGNIWLGTNMGLTQIKTSTQVVQPPVVQPKVVTVFVKSLQVPFDIQPVIREGNTLVSVRFILEALGQDVIWNEAERKVVSTGDKTIELTIGEKTGYIDGVAYPLNIPSEIIGGRTMIPLRWIAENLGYDVQWNPVNYRVEIN